MDDWQAFIADCSWFLRPGQTAQIGQTGAWDRGTVDGLPILSHLLAQADVTPVQIGEQHLELLAWGPAQERRGWLCLPPVVDAADDFHPVHRQLLGVCGGIIERFGEPDSWLLNQNDVWTLSAAAEDLAGGLEAYAWPWEEQGQAVPIDPQDHYVVAVEANGNLTIVHRDNGALLLFAPDHDFDGVTPLPGSTEYSLMTIDEAPDLASWLEVCAAAWTD
ncbi:hypothetical protein [Quadrisphaera granulorum]|uniref:hypothetical protein n=1 Tax=Quadrisphaera granulorum TaxID=317664 RepID=UPI001B85C6DA|nr:hypothetical protein [Quadrisphaera granulorum]